MKYFLKSILSLLFLSNVFALAGFGLNLNQGMYSVPETMTDLIVEELTIGSITHHGFDNGYGLGGYLYIDALPVVDVDIEATMHFSPYEFSFQNQITEIKNEKFGWADFALYGTLQKKILKLSIPFLAKAKLSAGAGINNHSSIPMIDQPMVEAVMGSGNISEGTLDSNELITYLKENKISSIGFHLQTGIQFKLLMLDSFLFYRHVFVKDVITDSNNFGSINLRIGMGF